MNIYKLTFLISEEDGFGPNKKAFVKHMTNVADKLTVLIKDRSLLVPANSIADLNLYSAYGGGIDAIECIGTIPDKFFQPLTPEADFVAEQIRSRKNGVHLGFQG